MVLTSILLVTKKFNDHYYSNMQIACAGGVTLLELNSLELIFLDTVEWSLNITTDEFAHYKAGFDNYVANTLPGELLQASRDALQEANQKSFAGATPPEPIPVAQ